MDSRLDEIEARYDELGRQLSTPEVGHDPDKLRKLGKAYAELGEIVVPYRQYKEARRQADEAATLAKDESDPEMAAFFKEEAGQAEERAGTIWKRLEELLVPKDPNDDKDVVLEIRAGPGGEEAALWAGNLFELYRRYAERRRWKTDVLS